MELAVSQPHVLRRRVADAHTTCGAAPAGTSGEDFPGTAEQHPRQAGHLQRLRLADGVVLAQRRLPRSVAALALDEPGGRIYVLESGGASVAAVRLF